MGKRVLLVGDSYGVERIHKGVANVAQEQTWPEQVKRAMAGKNEVISDFKAFRKLVDCYPVIEGYGEADVVVVHAGIVDCYPRPLNEALTRTKNPFLMVIRRISKLFRRQFILYLHRSAWVSSKQLDETLAKLSSSLKKVVFLTIVPVIDLHERNTPGANAAIEEFNNRLRKLAGEKSNVSVIDMHVVFLSHGHHQLLHPVDSHPNAKGHDLYAKEVIELLNKL